MEFYEVKISAETQAQADKILNSLLGKKLVTGGQFINTPARFLWKGEVNDMDQYITITSFTVRSNKEAIVEDVRQTSEEEVPMITFVLIDDLNSELKDWISQTVSTN